MTYLQPRTKKGSAWLPNQVVYGVDCSDPDPEKWTPFGEAHEAELSKHAAPKSSSEAKAPQ